MRQRLRNALQLLEQENVEQLVNQFLLVNYQRPRFDALFVALLNPPENRLECHFQPITPDHSGVKFVPSYLGSDDFSHPLSQVLLSGETSIWRTLNRGARIEHLEFQRFVQNLPHECGLYALPLFNQQNKVCGVVALFAEHIDEFISSDGMFSVYFQTFQYRMRHLYEIEHLHSQLHQVREVLGSLKVRQNQLDTLISAMSSSEPKVQSGLTKELHEITDLPKALDMYEFSILQQRLNLYGSDRQRMADSLNIAKRSLDYKLTKYKGLE